MHENDTVEKKGSYLHSYGSLIDMEILTLPLIKAKNKLPNIYF